MSYATTDAGELWSENGNDLLIADFRFARNPRLAKPFGPLRSRPKKATPREVNLVGQPGLRQPNVVTLALAAAEVVGA